MPDLTITVTDLQLKALRRLDAVLTARQVVQVHVDTWLAPIIDELDVTDRRAVAEAYVAATPGTKDSVKGLLGIG